MGYLDKAHTLIWLDEEIAKCETSLGPASVPDDTKSEVRARRDTLTEVRSRLAALSFCL